MESRSEFDGDPCDPLAAARALIAVPSVSRDSNAAVARVAADALVRGGFEVERTEYADPAGVTKVNLVARRGPASPAAGPRGFAWFGHTDVVPAARWSGPGGPFEPVVDGGRLYGRGACDMKGPTAAALAAAARVSDADLAAPLWVVLTADEETGFHGARAVAARSPAFAALRAADPVAVVGEPTSLRVVHAHKGSAVLTAVSHGTAAHSSTTLGRNANDGLIPFLGDVDALRRETETDPRWRDRDFDPPTVSWNVTLRNEPDAMNVTPARAECTVYFRPPPRVDADALAGRFHAAAASHGLGVVEELRAAPFVTDPHRPFVRAMCELTGTDRSDTVCYGTDAAEFRVLSDLVVCGPGSIRQAHTADEWIDLAELRRGADLYEAAIRRWCVGQ